MCEKWIGLLIVIILAMSIYTIWDSIRFYRKLERMKNEIRDLIAGKWDQADFDEEDFR